MTAAAECVYESLHVCLFVSFARSFVRSFARLSLSRGICVDLMQIFLLKMPAQQKTQKFRVLK